MRSSETSCAIRLARSSPCALTKGVTATSGLPPGSFASIDGPLAIQIASVAVARAETSAAVAAARRREPSRAERAARGIAVTLAEHSSAPAREKPLSRPFASAPCSGSSSPMAAGVSAELEHRHISAAWDRDQDRVVVSRRMVVSLKRAPQPPCLDAHDGIDLRIEGGRSVEHRQRDRVRLQPRVLARQLFGNDIAQETLEALGSAKFGAGADRLHAALDEVAVQTTELRRDTRQRRLPLSIAGYGTRRQSHRVIG